MAKLAFGLALVLGLLLANPAARAGGGYFVSYSYGYPYYCCGWYRPYWAYYPPPYYYYYPPPVYYVRPRESYCVQDQVYRYLPDGQIQWGTRTRCY